MSTSAVLAHLLTADAFFLLPHAGTHRALVRGEVVETMPPGGRHGAIASAINARLYLWASSGPGGCVGVESGFLLARDPDTMRGPGVFYVRPERIPPAGIPEAFWHLAPDLAVEVVSPTETAEEVREQVRDYLAGGTPLVWVVYPRSREVVAHTPDGIARTYAGDARLDAPDVLPGFACVVAELFGA